MMGHLGYQNGMILAILNLCVTVMLPIYFQLNWTYSFGGDIFWRISRWPPWRPSWISERNDFSNSEPLCHSDASHQVLAQFDLRFGRRCRLKNFKIGYRNGMILAILNLCVTVMPPIKFWLNLTYGVGDVAWRISRWLPWRPSWISERNDSSNFESLSDVSHQVSAQFDLQFGRRCQLKNFKMATMAAILDIGMERF